MTARSWPSRFLHVTRLCFQDTEGMRQILEERRRRKELQEAWPTAVPSESNGRGRGRRGAANGFAGGGGRGFEADSQSGGGGSSSAGKGDRNGDLTLLVNKLKSRGLQPPPRREGGGSSGRLAVEGGARLDPDAVPPGSQGGGVVLGQGSGEKLAGQGRRGKKKRRKA